jgi:hypothetical protein
MASEAVAVAVVAAAAAAAGKLVGRQTAGGTVLVERRCLVPLAVAAAETKGSVEVPGYCTLAPAAVVENRPESKPGSDERAEPSNLRDHFVHGHGADSRHLDDADILHLHLSRDRLVLVDRNPDS